MKKFALAVCVLVFAAFVGAPPAARASSGWTWRAPIVVRNDADVDLHQHQVRVELDAAHFDFARAADDLRDLRFTDDGGVRWLPHWVESYDRTAGRAIVWVKAPHVPARGRATIYAYYGNPQAHDLSSGFRTFEFFDDFGRDGRGYFALGAPRTIAEKDQPWETQAPHTLSVVELNRDGYRYWGYYGLADCGGIGLLRSNDLVKWDKSAEPILNRDGDRWPSAHYDGRTLYMVYDRDHCGTSHLVLRESVDGRSFSPEYTVLVVQEQGVRNQNPHLFFDESDGYYYLYWFRGGEEQGMWQIKARRARTPRELANVASEMVLLEEPYTLAAPNMLSYDGVYYLSTEVNENAWKTKIYAGPTPLGPFEPLPGAIVLSNNEACWFQHVFDGVLHGFYCKDTRGDGQGWVLQQRVGDLTQREVQRKVDGTFWSGGERGWRIEAGALYGEEGARLRANLPFDDAKIAEVVGGAVERVDGHAVLVGHAGAAYDDFRLRKRAVPEPTAVVERAQVRREAAQPWFAVGAGAQASSGPQSRPGPVGLLGAALLVLTALGAATLTQGRRMRVDRP